MSDENVMTPQQAAEPADNFDPIAFVTQFAEHDEPEEQVLPPEDLEEVSVNGGNFKVPKPIASVVNQGRRFQSEHDKAQQRIAELNAELAVLRNQNVQAEQERTRAVAPQPVSIFETPAVKELMAQAKASDEANLTGGVASNLVKSMFAIFDQVTQQNEAQQRELRDLLKAQQSQLSSVSALTAEQQIASEANSAVAWIAQQNQVQIPPSDRDVLVGELYQVLHADPNLSEAGKQMALELVWTRYQMAQLQRPAGQEPPSQSSGYVRRPSSAVAIPPTGGAFGRGGVSRGRKVADGFGFSGI